MAATDDVFKPGPPSAQDRTDAPYLLGLRLAGRRVLVVGGGAVADRRVPVLVRAGANVVLISPVVTAGLESMAAAGHLRWERRRYALGDVDGAWLVQTCTDDPAVNDAVAAECEAAQVWCVRADDRAASAAWTPASGQAGDTHVAVLTGDPRRSAGLRDAVVVKLRDGTLSARSHGNSTAPTDPADSAASIDSAIFTASIASIASSASIDPAVSQGSAASPASVAPTASADTTTSTDSVGSTTSGTSGLPGVALVGGGPGDPGLITVRGMQLLAEADVVITDRLAPRSLLDELAPDVEIIDASKIPYGRAMAQDHINAALIENALAGRFVVRLKGGDPFVFGRGAEEVLACLRAGVPVTVVPGVTSAIAVPAAAFVPVTHRGLARQFHVVSAHVASGDERSTVNWAPLAQSSGTIVLLMAVERLEAIADALIRHGRVATTPVTVIQDGTLPTQQTLTATLGTVADEAAAAGIRPPAVVVVGEVVNIAAQIEELLPGRQRWIGKA